MHMHAALPVLPVLLAVLHSAGVATDLPRDMCGAGGVARACSAMQLRLSQLPASLGLQDREARVRLAQILRQGSALELVQQQFSDAFKDIGRNSEK